MIAVKSRPATAGTSPAPQPPIPVPGRSRFVWTGRLSAFLLLGAVLVSLGGGGVLDVGSVYSLQARAEALHAHWPSMVASGIPETDLDALVRVGKYCQALRLY